MTNPVKNTPILKSLVSESTLVEWPWSKKKEEEPVDDTPKQEVPDIDLKTLDIFASKLIQTTPDTTRYVLRVTASSIRNLYFDAKGPANFVAAMSDEVLEQFVASPLKVSSKSAPNIQQMPSNFKFSDQLKSSGSANYAILLNVPTELLKKLSTARSAGEQGINEARSVLTEMLHHSYYIMVLSIPASKKIANEIDAAGQDLERVIDVLTPDMLVAMPKAGEVKVVRDAILEYAGEKAESGSEDQSNDSSESPTQQTTSTGNVTKDFKNLLDTLAAADSKTFNQVSQLLADIGHATDKKKKMAEIAKLLGSQ